MYLKTQFSVFVVVLKTVAVESWHFPWYFDFWKKPPSYWKGLEYSLRYQKQSSGGVLWKRCEKFLQYLQENTCVGVFFNKVTGLKIWPLRNYQEHLFWRTPASCCIWVSALHLSKNSKLNLLAQLIIYIFFHSMISNIKPK